MKPIRANEQTLCCVHWRQWPPAAAFLGESPEALRASRAIDEAGYGRLSVWRRVCGLLEMSPAKCAACPMVRRVERRALGVYLVTLDGKTAIPTFDLGKEA